MAFCHNVAIMMVVDNVFGSPSQRVNVYDNLTTLQLSTCIMYW